MLLGRKGGWGYKLQAKQEIAMSELPVSVRETIARFIKEFASEHGLKFLYIEYDGEYPYDPDGDAEAEWKPVKPEAYASGKKGRTAMWILYFPEKVSSDEIPMSDTISVSLREEANTLRISACNFDYKFPSDAETLDKIKAPLKRIVKIMTIPPMSACPLKYFYKYTLRSSENG